MFLATNGEQTIEVVQHMPVQMTDIPALAELHPKLVALGWQLTNTTKPLTLSISAKTTNGQAQPLKYYFAERALYRHASEPVVLRVDISSGLLERYPTPEQALQASAVSLYGLYKVDPIESGKGQLTRAREEAIALLPLAESLPLPVSRIVVSYHTRGGKGGWMAKVADKFYTLAELKAPPKLTRAQQFPSIRCFAKVGAIYNGSFDQWWRKRSERQRSVFLRPEGISYSTWGEVYSPTEERIDGDWVVCRTLNKFGNSNGVLLLKESDYARLVAKSPATPPSQVLGN